ncbi:MAG: S9 family peptidase, partial [Verrucomicrobia bacterium]
IYIRGTSGNAAATMVSIESAGERTDSDPTWSPDSKTLAFFSSGSEKEQRQLWTVNANGSKPKKITNLNGYAARPRWSHDGKQIAFLYIEGAGGGGPLMAAPSTTGVIDTAIHNQRLAIIPPGQSPWMSPPDLHVYDFDWSPDDKRFVTTAAPGPGDNNWWIAQIYTIDIAKGNASSIYKPSLQVAVPRWSPDGKSCSFIEGLMSDEGFHGGDLFTISADGHDVQNRTRGRKSSVSSLFWQTPDRILFTEYVGGGSAISELTLSDNSVRTIWKGTANNSAQTPTWGKAENLEWTNDGFSIQGWLLTPSRSRGMKAGEKYPMVVLIHGGPSNLTTPEWPAGFGMSRAIVAALSSRGYYVLLPNPRGSYGQGEDFTRANVKDFGGGDLRDILAGIDAAIAKYPINPARLGVTGWSYGGFMTMWTVTQTNRFRGAVAGAGLANWQSYYGQNLIDQWMIPFFGSSVYDDPGIYEKSSPIHYIKKVKTPTLVIVGERDAECPAPQSYEFWHALKALGVPTQLIVYPGEGHLFIKPENQNDRLDQTVAWFDKYLQ